jgi:radical SAM superfamily enzyme YgiQ (UPF0313 family)
MVDVYGNPRALFKLLKGPRGMFTPLGILTAMNYFPPSWEQRLIDEMCGDVVTADDLHWADIVCLSGMYVQARRCNELARRAAAFGKVTVVGGPSVTLNPQRFPDVDLLHIGELGDGTYELIRHLDDQPGRPAAQMRFTTVNPIPLEDQPLPAFERVNMNDYLILSMQYSKGCPFNCEFCDVIEIFGRVPECKSPKRFLRELDMVYAYGWRGQVFAVSDNFIGNHKLAREILPQVADWQRTNDFPFAFMTCATLNVAHHADLMEKLRDAHFTKLQIGIESAEAATLVHTQKKQNLRHPLVESIRRIHAHGIDIAATFILGFDTDTPESGNAMRNLINEANLAFCAIGMLVALEGTQLTRRLAREGRLKADFPHMHYKMGDDAVLKMFNDTTSAVYDPAELYRRFSYHVTNVWPNRSPDARLTRGRALRMARRELMRRFGLSKEIALDSRNQPIPVKAVTPKLMGVLRTFIATAVKAGIKSQNPRLYWEFLKLCIRQGDPVSALTVPVLVTLWGEFARARFNPNKAGKVAQNFSVTVDSKSVPTDPGLSGVTPQVQPATFA